MRSEDVGKNLTGVQTLIRKHDILVKDMSAIEDRKKELEGRLLFLLLLLNLTKQPRNREATFYRSTT